MTIEYNGVRYLTKGSNTLEKEETPFYLTTDMMRVELRTDETLLCEFCSSGEFRWPDGVRPLVIRRIRKNNDARQIEKLYEFSEKQNLATVIRQPLNPKGKATGMAMEYTGTITEVRCDPYHANQSKLAYLTVVIAKPTLTKHG